MVSRTTTPSGRGRAPAALLGLLLLACSGGSIVDETGATSTTAAITGDIGGPPTSTGGTPLDTGDGTSTTDPTSTGGGTSTTDTSSTGGETTGEASSSGTSTGSSTTGDTTTGDPACVPPEMTTGGDPPPPPATWEDHVLAECEAWLGCGCVAPDEFGVDMATCLATRGAELAALADQGYAWDPECAVVRLAGLAAACVGGASGYTCEMYACTPFHKEVGYGEKCDVTVGSTDWWDATTCAEGLECQGLCVPRCGDVVACGLELCAPGQFCHDMEDIGVECWTSGGPGETCEAEYPCEPGLECVPDDDQQSTCKPVSGACEPCGACEAGLYCHPDMQVCVPQQPTGEACASDAACETHTCGPGGVCDPWPGASEPCPDGRCADGLACANTQTCVPAAQRGEPCKALDNCAPGLLCFFEDYCELPVCGPL